jgi:RNA polymerase sigma-70 factor (ECF subfamily)
MFTNTDLMNNTERLERFAYKLTNNKADAEDLLQSTLLRALEKKHLFQEGTNLYSWLSKVMYNMFVSAYRRRTKFETQYDPEPYIEKQKLDADQDKKMEVQDVEHAMNEISKDHRDILIMVCVKGMAYAEVSEVLQVPVGTVRSRLSRARENLQAALDTPKKSTGRTPKRPILRHPAFIHQRQALAA